MQGHISAMKIEAAEHEYRTAKDAAERTRKKLIFWVAGTAVGMAGLLVVVVIGFATVLYNMNSMQQGAANVAAAGMQASGQQW